MDTDMTAEAALYNFFSSFQITAYANTAVPEESVLPYLTYSNSMTGWGDSSSITVQLWYYTESEAIPNAKAREIYDALKNGGVYLPCDGGSIWLTIGSPFCQSFNDENNRSIKRRLINITRKDYRT